MMLAVGNTAVAAPERSTSKRGRVREWLVADWPTWLAGNWPFVIVLVGGVALRGLIMVAYDPALPPRNADAAKYLFRASTLSSEGSYHPFFYSVLIRLLTLLGSVSWVTTAQHLAGVAMAALLFALMRRHQVPSAIAALGTVPVLFDGYLLNLEHQFMSETFFNLLVVLGLFFATSARPPSLVGAGASGVFLGLASITRFAGLAVIVAVLLYGLVRRFGWKRLATLAVAFLLTLAGYAAWFSTQSGSFGITDRQGFFLYGRVVSFADCREVGVPSDLRVFCPEGHPPTGPGLFKSGLPKEVRQDPQNNSKAQDFARRMILAKPWAFATAVAADFGMYFETGAHRAQNQWRFPPGGSTRVGGPPTMRIIFRSEPGPAAFLRRYQSVAWVHGPLLAALLLLGAVGGVIGWVRRTGVDLGMHALLFTLAALGLLLFATVFAVYHFRYVLPAIPLVGPGAAFGVMAALTRGPRPVPAPLPPAPAAGEAERTEVP
jgi:hypothetical protein